MNCQIVHDSIHRRTGWTEEYAVERNGRVVGFASIAIAGPWKEKRTLLDFYTLPEERSRTFDYFERFAELGKPAYFEIQSNDVTAQIIALTFGREMESEKIVFEIASERLCTIRELR